MLIGLLCVLGTTTGAYAAHIVVVGSNGGSTCREFLEGLRAELPAGVHTVVSAGNVEEGVDIRLFDQADLILTTGPSALRAVLTHTQLPVLATLLTEAQLAELKPKASAGQVGAIVLDQPIERHLALVRSVLPNSAQVGLMMSTPTASPNSIAPTLSVHHISNAQQLLPTLDSILSSSDALLSLPDPITASPQAIRPILLSSYRHRRPVFGFSRAYVDAGALAAVFSTPRNLAQDTAKVLKKWDGSAPPLTESRAPRRFEIAVNRKVARALGLNLEDDASLMATLYARGAP